MSDNPYELPDGGGRLEPLVGLAGRLASRARAARYERYRRTMKPGPGENLLDVGCGGSWSLAALEPEANVTGVDLNEPTGFGGSNQRFVRADACELPFEDHSFDLAYSNSLIEHIDPSRRAAYADEIRRVAGRYWVQTPNYWFPIEPHALLPAVQFLPVPARRLAWRGSPRGIDYEESLHLLTRRELAELFDDALILDERVGPFTKSLIAIGPRELFRRLS